MLDSIINLYYKIWYWFDRRNIDPQYQETEQEVNTGLYGPSSPPKPHPTPHFTDEEFKNLTPRIFSEDVPLVGERPAPGADHLQILEHVCSELEEYIFHHPLSKNITPPAIKVYPHIEEGRPPGPGHQILLYTVVIKATPIDLLRLQMTIEPQDQIKGHAAIWNILYQKIIADIYEFGFEALTLRYYELIKAHRIIPLSFKSADNIVLP